MDKVIDIAFDWVGIAFLAAVLAIMCGSQDMPEGMKIFQTLNVTLIALAAIPD